MIFFVKSKQPALVKPHRICELSLEMLDYFVNISSINSICQQTEHLHSKSNYSVPAGKPVGEVKSSHLWMIILFLCLLVAVSDSGQPVQLLTHAKLQKKVDRREGVFLRSLNSTVFIF